MYLPTHYLFPALLNCIHFNGYLLHSKALAERTVYEYEFEFFLQSDGGILINGVYVPFKAGELNIRKPGQLVQGIAPYESYILCVDFQGNAVRSDSQVFGAWEEAQEVYENPLLSNLPDRFTPFHPEIFSGLLENILQRTGQMDDLSVFQNRTNVTQFLAELFTELLGEKTTGSTAPIRRAVRQIQEHFTENICIDHLIAESGLSKGFFHKQFRLETGTTPLQLLTSLRLDKAKTLLRITSMEIAEIAYACGYPDNSYFTRVFHRETGFTPSAYRELGQHV